MTESSKEFITVPMTIDNVLLSARFSTKSRDEVFIPLLKRLTDMYRQKKRRIIVFLGASPGAGKSMLVNWLETLSRETEGVEPVRALGLDGFHYHSEKIAESFVTRDGVTYPMKQVKGWAETFDAEKLAQKLREIREKDKVLCPRYDRNIHDPVEDAISIDSNIVIVEGMWMVYGMDRWADVQSLGDYRILLLSEVPTLRARYIERKMRGGWSFERSRDYFNNTDCRAIKRIVCDACEAELYLESLEDDDIIDLNGKPKDLTRFYIG